MVLQIMGSTYDAYIKYFKITDGVVFGIKTIVQVSSFQYNLYDFAMRPSVFNVILIQSGQGTFWTSCISIVSFFLSFFVRSYVIWYRTLSKSCEISSVTGSYYR